MSDSAREWLRLEEGSPVDLRSLIGRPLELVGILQRSKIPTLCEVQVAEDDALAGQRVRARGILTEVRVEPPPPGAPIAAGREPGVYYALRTPTGALAQPESSPPKT